MNSFKTVSALFLAAMLCAPAAELTLRITPSFGSSTPALTAHEGGLSFSRVDLLLSQFSLQSPDGSWIEAREDLFGFVSLAQNRLHVPLGKVPAGTYQAVRFTVGLPAEANQADPNSFPADHPLHPQLNKLHWSWQGGYIFLALEGYNGPGEGFLYHLGNLPNATQVIVPVALDTSTAQTVQLRFDLATLFGPGGLDPQETSSTHSREGDPTAARIREKLTTAFSAESVVAGSFQSVPREAPALARGTPYPLQISTGLPKVALPADNPLTVEGVALGQRLFSDPILSHRETQSCTSCHQQKVAFSDEDKAFSLGATGGLGTRNTMPLFNLAWHKEFFWDGRAASLREQVLHPITDPNEMASSLDEVMSKLNQHPDYPALFATAFGAETITPDHLGLALEQFLLTLVSQDSRFDRALRREVEFTPQEKRGFELFVTEYDPQNNLLGADCFHCHGGALFSSLDFSNNGLDATFAEDPGRFRATGEENDRGKFKVPSLRNVALTAPYMHDGRFETLTEVISHYNSGVQRSATLDPNLAKHPETKLELTTADQEALIAFLQTLTDTRFTSPKPPLNR